jgi:hypothetical protein
MKPQKILKKTETALRIISETASRYHGLFPSIMDCKSGEMLMNTPGFEDWHNLETDKNFSANDYPPGGGSIPGQRNGDRAPLGSNLIHDEALLKTMYGFSDSGRHKEFSRAADSYLNYFANKCSHTPTGLFPWGEHAYWHLLDNTVGNVWTRYIEKGQADAHHTHAIHDHLRQAPLWLWQKLHEFNPVCVQKFADGLDLHWLTEERDEYSRHAHILVKEFSAYICDYSKGSADFPRHGGMYILDWAFAFSKQKRDTTLQQIERMVDHHWNYQRHERGFLNLVKRNSNPEVHAALWTTGQTLSLAVSLLESCPLLETSSPELTKTMRERAEVYIDGFFNAPHDIENGVFVDSFNSQTNRPVYQARIWGSKYGQWPVAYVGLFGLCGYRLCSDPRLLHAAEKAGEGYINTSFPSHHPVPAMDAGLALGLLADLYEITGEERWITGGLELADTAMKAFFTNNLPSGATTVDFYDSQMGPSFLIHGLARIALLACDGESALEADYTAR